MRQEEVVEVLVKVTVKTTMDRVGAGEKQGRFSSGSVLLKWLRLEVML